MTLHRGGAAAATLCYYEVRSCEHQAEKQQEITTGLKLLLGSRGTGERTANRKKLVQTEAFQHAALKLKRAPTPSMANILQ